MVILIKQPLGCLILLDLVENSLMNYQHCYHAGNAADVFKHIILVQLFQQLLKKPQPFFYLDTHAGLPSYDLTSREALATNEFAQGIELLWAKPLLESAVVDYLQLIQQLNHDQTSLRFYPGSPVIAQTLLRKGDRAIVCDIQQDIQQQLKYQFRHQSAIQAYQQDGYQALKAFLPPSEKRGLVLIDPPYEENADWIKLPAAVQATYQRWPTGMYAVWFPIKEPRLVKQLLAAFTKTAIPNMLLTEFCPWPQDVPHRLNGSGVILINPPWQLDIKLKHCLPPLLETLRQHPRGTTQTVWLTAPL